jgi:hypothetical protein
MSTPQLELNADPPDPNSLHQDLPPSYPSSDVPTRPHSWIAAHRLPPLSTPIPVPTSRSEARTPPSLPGRKGQAPSPSRHWLLRRLPHHLRWARRNMDKMVSILAGPSPLGDMVDAGWAEMVGTTSSDRVLGNTGDDLGSGVESAAEPREETSAICGTRSQGRRWDWTGAYPADRRDGRQTHWTWKPNDGCGGSAIAHPQCQFSEKVLSRFGSGHVCSRHSYRCKLGRWFPPYLS